MAGTVNIGTIEGVLKLIDSFTGPMKDVAAKLDKLTDLIDKDLKNVDKSVDKVGQSFGNLGKEIAGNFTKVLTATALVSGSIALVTNVTKQLAQANIEAEASERKVEEAVRRYGESSGVTVDQVDELAQSISKLSGIDDELIADAEILALKYNRIGTEILPRLTKAATDMAVATGQDLSSAFEKAGKIVNQPLKGLTLLAREGYAVSKSQSDMVKSLVKSGDILSAQGIMLDILEGQYEGAAAAARDTMAGALQALSTTWENFLERVGQDNMGPIRQALEKLISLLETATDRVYEFELGFHHIKATSAGFLAEALSGWADFTDLLSKAALAMGQFMTFRKLQSVSKEARVDSEKAAEIALREAEILAKLLLEGEKGHKKSSSAALEQTEAEAKLGKEINKLTDSIKLSIEEMQRKAVNARNLYLAALISTKAYNAEVLKQKVVEAILREENKLRETGGKLTIIQRNAIAQAIIAEDEFNKKLKVTLDLYEALIQSALTATSNIAGRGFARDFKLELDKIHEGIEKINQDVEEMLGALDFKKGLENDLEFNLRLSGIDEIDPHLRQIEQDYIQFLSNLGQGSVSEGERIFSKMAERFRWTVDDIKKELATLSDIDLAIEFKSQLNIPDTPNKKLLELQKTLKRLEKTTDDSGNALLTAAESQEIYSKAVAEGMLEFASSAMSVIEQLYGVSSESNKWGKALSGLSGVVSSGGYNIAAWLEMFIGLAEGFTDKGGIHAGAELNTGAAGAGLADSWTMVKGQLKEIRKQAQEIADAINDTVQSLGGILVDLPGIEILQKGEGWVINIEGELRRYFEDFNEAVAYAASKAIQESEIYGIDEEIMKAFKDLDFSSLEEIREFTDYAREYTSYGASDLTNNLRSLTDWLLESSRKAIEFGLSIAKVGEEFGRRAQAWRDQILGIVLSEDEKVSRDVQDFNKWRDQEELSAQIQIDAAEAQMIAAKMQMDAAWAELKASGMADSDPETRALFLEGQRLWKEAGARLDLWTKTLQNLPPAITPEEEEQAKKRRRKGGGGGGKGSQKDSVRDWIEDRDYELNSRGLDEWTRRANDISRQYDQQLEQAGKDKKLREELIGLKERELRLLEEERIQVLQSQYTDFVGDDNQFTEIENAANTLISAITSSPLGDPKKASMIADILEKVNSQIEELSLTSAASLFGELIQDLDRFGAEESLMNEARTHLAIIEHTLKVAHYRTEFEILKANGRLSQEILETLGKSIEFVAGIDPTEFIDNDRRGFKEQSSKELNSTVNNVVADLERLRESFKSAKDKILDTVQKFDRGEFGAITPETGWLEAEKQFNDVVASAQAGNLEAFEKAPEAFQNALDVLEKFSPALYATRSKELRDQLAGLGNLTTVKEGNLVLTDFDKKKQHEETIDTLKTGFADLSGHATANEDFQIRILERLETSNRTQQDLASRLARLEAGQIAQKR